MRSPPAACASPLAPLARPTLEVPPNACDCHAHVFGFPPRHPFGGDLRYTPAHDSQAPDYIRMLQSLGIGRAVVVQPTIYHDNQVTLDGIAALKSAGIDARGIALVPLNVEAEEIARLDRAGVRGIRIHLRESNAQRSQEVRVLAQLDALAERIAPFGWHLQMHLDGSRLPGLREWIGGLPVPLVLDHFARVDLRRGAGDPSYTVLLRLLEERKCWVKLSAANRFDDPLPPYPALRASVRELVTCAPDRLVWGSDWPHSSFTGVMPSDAALLDLLADWAPDAAIRHQILVTNPETLYRFARSA